MGVAAEVLARPMCPVRLRGRNTLATSLPQ